MSRLFQIKVKYLADRVVSLVLLVFLIPVFLIIALGIKLDDGGPVFFKQRRPGLDARPFTIWKFRTMVPDADRFLDTQGRVSINRVTRVGRILRLLSLDELPQLINIAKGEMSFVGPRPGLLEHVPRYTKQQRKRFVMKPGITGLAQVNGRNTLSWSQRINYDLQYIENYSLWLDLKVLFRTVKVVLLREGIVIDRNPEQVDDLRKSVDTSVNAKEAEGKGMK